MSESDSSKNLAVVVGLGYVGLTLAVHLANRGFRVHGVEIRDEILSGLKMFKSFFSEPGLDDILEKVLRLGDFTFSSEIPDSTQNRIFFITVGTPLNQDRSVNINHLVRASQSVQTKLKSGDFCILRSTVKLGTTNGIVRPILNQSKMEFGLAFCPERTLEGAALRELAYLPQIIGADSVEEVRRASEIFDRLTTSVVTVSNIETAELIKLTDNMQRDVIFGVANEVARACNQHPISPHEVISAGKLNYPRTNLPLPGPVGGPCLEKDTYILNESLGWKSSISLSARNTNELLVPESLTFLQQMLRDFSHVKPSDDKAIQIGILGLAFKGLPETDDLRGSIGVFLLNQLLTQFSSSTALVYDSAIRGLPMSLSRATRADSIKEVFESSQIVIITNNHPEFSNLDMNVLGREMNERGLIYDLWGRYPTQIDENGNLCFSWGTFALARKLVA